MLSEFRQQATYAIIGALGLVLSAIELAGHDQKWGEMETSLAAAKKNEEDYQVAVLAVGH